MSKRGHSPLTGPSMDYEAEDDARTMMHFVRIQKDAKRLKRAQKALDRLEKEAQEASLERKAAKGLKSSFSEDK